MSAPFSRLNPGVIIRPISTGLKGYSLIFICLLFRLTILSGSGSLGTDSTILPFPDLLDSVKIEIIQPANMEFPPVPDEDIFDAQMAEAKAIYAEAVISDLTGDTLDAAYQFELLFEALANIEVLSNDDEFQTLEFNRILTAAIDYYEDESVTLGKVETGFSVALLKDKLNEYIYSQTLEDL